MSDKYAIVFLRRLRRLRDMRTRLVDDLNPQGVRLLDHAIYSTYCDLRAIGSESPARLLLNGNTNQSRDARASEMIG